ncbi:zinc metalloproteinase nas-4-like [Bacillus rossius redtenbacheri]|uniref:zinc metalloproteinase nas-4-like n=1 Tax=Bacillus rossius redtenbacheri TaxID=93214 RepID=UPI002FDCF84D
MSPVGSALVPALLGLVVAWVPDDPYLLQLPPPAVSEALLGDIPLGVPDEEKDVPGEPLTPEDFQNAENLELLVPPQEEGSVDPLEVAGLFEGDIAGVNVSELILEKNAARNPRKRWSYGLVPYVISASFNSYERSVIAAAFLDYHRHTCVKFVPRSTQRDHIHLMKGAGCSSHVGRSQGGQQVSLGPGCLYKGVVVHELMHAVGFWHEQSRTDRDEHVSVLWDNIQPGMEFNFHKFSWKVMQDLGVPYDTVSVMHYGMFAFSKDRRSPTILPKRPNTPLGQRRGFSEADIVKVNRLYECREVVTERPPTVTKPGECADNHGLCQRWARRGECGRNPAWMLVNCARACEQCGGKCSDHNRFCGKWALAGECRRNPDYMNVYCARACVSCPEPGDSCTDDNEHCAAWAETDQCQLNPEYMLRKCRKSCRRC